MATYAELLQNLVAAGEAALLRDGIEPLEGVRGYPVGTLPWECPGLFAWVTAVTPRQPLTSSPVPGVGKGCTTVPGVTMNLTMLRCIIETFPATDYELTSPEGLRTANDLQALSLELIFRQGAGTLFPGADCAAVAITQVSVQRQGGMVGITATVTVSGTP